MFRIEVTFTHIANNYACDGGKKSFFYSYLGQSETVTAGRAESIIPLFRVIVTEMGQWLYIESKGFWSSLI